MFFVSEIFSHRQSCQRNSHSCARRFVHLSEYHGCLVNNARLDHLVVQIVTFSCSLAYSGEYRDTAVFLGYIVDKLLYQYSLAYTCTSEQTYLTASGVRCDQVYYLDTRLEYLC